METIESELVHDEMTLWRYFCAAPGHTTWCRFLTNSQSGTNRHDTLETIPQTVQHDSSTGFAVCKPLPLEADGDNDEHLFFGGGFFVEQCVRAPLKYGGSFYGTPDYISLT